MALNAPNRRWNAWTALTTVALVASNFWIPVSNAAALAPREDPIANNVELRVLPIGDSITYGAGSTNYNGYRKSLYSTLAGRGNSVDFVGSLSSGDFADTDHEGHRGFVIDEIAASSLEGIYAAPNIVLLHAGTNDMMKDVEILKAPSRLKSLINLIYSKSPDAAVFVCQIIPASPVVHPGTAPRVEDFNKAIPDLVDGFVNAGKHVTIVPMNQAVSVSDLADGLHPNDRGYQNMADAYYAAIQAADAKGWISKPGKGSTPPTTTNPDKCRSTPSWYNVGQIADGAKVATTDGDFKPGWVERGVIADGACNRGHLHFMDLDGDGLKDYACVDPDTGETTVQINIPDADGKSANKWDDRGTIATGAKGRKGAGVMFADLNGDGRDDYIYIDSRNGAVSAWINRGMGDSIWQWQGLGVIASGVGATTKNLQMVDLNGDGRADFCIVDSTTGAVTAWLNTGAASIPDYHKLGVIATGASFSSGNTVILGDFTGEGRADYMIVGDDGKVNGLVNRLIETTLAPRWLPTVTIAEGPDGVDQDAVRMVDMTGDGKVDYLAVGKKGKVKLWENIGTGGKYQPGEGVILCDLNGDNTSDYFWLDHEGRGWGYLNIGKGENKWYGLGEIAKGTGHKREQIRMGVLTKSGRADYIAVDDDTGRAQWWQNLGEDWDYNWVDRGVAATGPKKTIEDMYGWKFRGKNVRFADLDGDGLDDYLYVNDQGAVVYWKNLGTGSATGAPSWGLPHLVADGVGVLAQDVQFADTNGDGLLDYVVVGRVTGRSRSWHNLGFRDDQSIRWNTPLSFADGTGSAGFAIRIAEMTGDNRADYVSIDPDTGRLNLWHNRCYPIDGGGDDPDNPDDPPYAGRSQQEWCHLSDQHGFVPSQQSYLWGSGPNELGVGQWLDEWLVSKKEKNWVVNIREAYEDALDDLDGLVCNNILSHDTCNFYSLPSCDDFYLAGAAPLYWILRAVSNLNDVVTQTATALGQTAIGELLSIDSVVDKFGHKDKDTSALDIFTTALSAAGAAAAGSAPISGAIGGLSSFITLMSQLGPSDENQDDLLASGALQMLYTSTRRGLRALLYLTVEGSYKETSTPEPGEDPIEDPQTLEPSDLPNLEDASYQTSIAKFFQDGQWLIDNDKLAHDMQTWEESFQSKARQAIITALLRNQRWFVYINEDLDTEDSCSRTEGTNNDGRRWIDGWCYDLWVWLYDLGQGPDGVASDLYANSADSEADEKFKAMQKEAYGSVDLVDIYKNAVDCALKNPNGDGAPDLTNLELAGGYPVCFFAYPVVRGKRDKGNLLEWYLKPAESEPYINTSDRHQDWWWDPDE